MGRSEHFNTGRTEQLKMFMSPDELIDTTNKMDSQFYDVFEQRATANPRKQWEDPYSGEASVHPEEPHVRSRSLRQEKLDAVAGRPDFAKSPDTVPPVELTHYRSGSKRPLLTQGHHRLAHAEARKTPFLAVIHHRGEV